MFIVGTLSCISQPDFSDLYTAGLGFLPLAKSTRTFLVNHYKIGHSVLYGLLTVVFFYSLKKHRLILAPILAFAFGLFVYPNCRSARAMYAAKLFDLFHIHLKYKPIDPSKLHTVK